MKLCAWKAILHGIRKADCISHTIVLVLSQDLLFLAAYMQQFYEFAIPSKCLIYFHQHTYKTKDDKRWTR